jgi:hypothetical protein
VYEKRLIFSFRQLANENQRKILTKSKDVSHFRAKRRGHKRRYAHTVRTVYTFSEKSIPHRKLEVLGVHHGNSVRATCEQSL